MKRLLIIACCIGIVFPLVAEDNKPSASEAQADTSYDLGMLMGGNLKSTGLSIDIQKFMAGLKDSLSGTTKYTTAEAQAAVQVALQDARNKKGAENLAAGKAFLDDNSKKAGVKVTASGLQYEVVSLGTGPKPTSSDTVKVNYEGRLIGGTVFDSSIARNKPAVFPLNSVIAGWIEGLQLMPVGSKFRFYVPSELAYGERGAGGLIGPNAVLIFDVELLSIETGKN
jgi:FKBP-type peptidyl-prolyl cis-trans isomerase